MSSSGVIFTDPLHACSAAGNVEGLQRLRAGLGRAELEHFDWNKLCPQTHTWQSALHLAAEAGHFDCVYFLLRQRNVRVDEADREGYTPLHCAASNLHLRVCSLLLTRGANPNVKNSSANSPMHYIIRGSYTEELIEVLDLCIARGGDLEWRNKYGETLLLVAASRSASAENVRFLLDHGADVNARDAFGVSALHRAIEGGAHLNVKLLLKHGADTTLVAEKIGSPLDCARRLGDLKMIAMLERAAVLLAGKRFDHDDSTYDAYETHDDGAEQSSAGLFVRQEDTTFETQVVDPEAASLRTYAGAAAEREQLCRKHSGQLSNSGSEPCSGDHGGSDDQWYYPGLSRTDAEFMMASQSQKAFLVRDSSVEGCYALTMGDQTSLSHLLISPVLRYGDVEGAEPEFLGYQIDPSQNLGMSVDCALYPSVSELIHHSPELQSFTAMGKLLQESSQGPIEPQLDEGMALTKMPSMSEMVLPVVGDAPGFVIEKPDTAAQSVVNLWDDNKMSDLLMFEPYHYQYYVYRSDHYVFLGTINQRGSKTAFEPIVVIAAPFSSIDGECQVRVIIDTRLGDTVGIFTGDDAFERSSSKKGYWEKQKTLPGPVMQFAESLLRSRFSRQQDNLSINVEQVKGDQQLRDDLLQFEMKDPLRKKVFSIGLLHSVRGQVEEHEQFSNNVQTPLLQEFMAFLGDKIRLPGWKGYKGDLSVTSDATGEYGLFRRWKGFEIMFHASTLLPYQEGTTEQLHRKRRIGNDIAVIIFQEGGTYTPPIRSQFLHAYLVVAPVVKNGETFYRLSVSTQEGVPNFPPAIPEPALFPKTPAFRTFLLTKVINGVLASMNHPALREKIWCHPKEVFLKDLIGKYGAKSSQRNLNIQPQRKKK